MGRPRTRGIGTHGTGYGVNAMDSARSLVTSRGFKVGAALAGGGAAALAIGGCGSDDRGREPVTAGGPPRTGTPPEITLGQLNTGNLFDTEDTPRRQDDVPTADEYEQHLRKLALTLRDTMGGPDVVTLQEVENERVLEDLVDRPELADLGYRPIIREGRDIRGIDVAMLYREDRVEPAAIATWDPDGESATGRRSKVFTRPPLVVDFQSSGSSDASRGAVTVATVHLTSKVQGEAGERRRLQQSAAITDAVNAARSAAPSTPVVISGDFNMTSDEQPYRTLRSDAARGADLLAPLDEIAEEDRYSYRRGSKRDLLDHVLVTSDLAASEARIPHSNTAATAAIKRDPDQPGGASDHDPVVLRLGS